MKGVLILLLDLFLRLAAARSCAEAVQVAASPQQGQHQKQREVSALSLNRSSQLGSVASIVCFISMCVRPALPS